MKKLIFLCGMLLGFFSAYAQTLVPTPSVITTGAHVSVVASGETSSTYFQNGDGEGVYSVTDATTGLPVATSYAGITIQQPECFYGTCRANGPTTLPCTLTSTYASKVTVVFYINLFYVLNNAPQGPKTEYFTETINPVSPPPTVTFNVNLPNQTTGTSFELSDGPVNINSGYTVKGTPAAIFASFNPYSGTNPYTQITASATSTIVIYATYGYMPVSATLIAGGHTTNGVVVPATYSNPESITFSNVNITTAPQTISISLY